MQNKKMSTEIGILESIDSSIDYIFQDIEKNISKHYYLSNSDKNFIEYNRFEKSNMVIANYYEQYNNFKQKFKSEKLIELIYKSITKPLISENEINEYDNFIDNCLGEINNEENSLFNNHLLSWYDFSDFETNHINELKIIIDRILGQNLNNKTHLLNEFDPIIYQEIKKNPLFLKQLDWRTFEKLLANILEKLEYEVELQKGTKDGGVDVIAIKKDTPFGVNRYLIQAKRWNKKIGIEPVRSLIWAHNEYKATKSCLATTSTFTKGAWDLANKHKWQIELKDYESILEWIEKAEKTLPNTL